MSSSGRNKKGQGEDDRRKRSNAANVDFVRSAAANVDFVQRYSQEEYSRAIPTNVLAPPQPKPRLGEYCVPVDSKPLQKKSSLTLDDYNRDVEVGYAQPQDSLLAGNVSNARKGKKDEDADSDDEGEVYELAKQTPEDYQVSPAQKKPSPKPRKSQVRSPQHEIKIINTPSENFSSSSASYAPSKNEDDTASSEYNLASATGFDPTQDQFPSERRRPPKKVVEIEYEVASEIRKSQPLSIINPPPTSNPPSQRSSLQAFSSSSSSNSKDSVLPGVKIASQTQNQTPVQNYPLPSPQVFHQSPSESSQKQPQFTQEEVYEEPWDLKAKRLKQEQEEKKLSRKKSEVNNIMESNPPVYEEAWDSALSQKKLDEKLKFARGFSTVSEGGDVYHDAVEDVSKAKMESRHDPVPQPKAPVPNLQIPQSQPTDTYEDAWDLKNKMLEERLSKIHMQATSTYEEPWDNTRRQKELQEKLQRTRIAAGDKPVRVGPNLSGPVIRSTSDARDHVSQTAQETKANYISRGRHHSIDNSNMKSKSRSAVVGQRINPSIPLINQSWFHGNISREDAEQMLCVCREGSFIVRISSDRKSYSLSIKSAKQNIHVQIEQSAQIDGSLRYILGKNSKEFTTIPEMIDYYTQHRVPLKGAEHITLLHPVECKWSQQS